MGAEVTGPHDDSLAEPLAQSALALTGRPARVGIGVRRAALRRQAAVATPSQPGPSPAPAAFNRYLQPAKNLRSSPRTAPVAGR